MRVFPVLLVVLVLSGCYRPGDFVGPAGEVFDGRALRGVSVPRYLGRFPDGRIPVTGHTRLSNLLRVGGVAFTRPGTPEGYGESAGITVIVTNFLHIHDISVVAKTNIKEPIEKIQKTNTVFRISDDFEYTEYRRAEVRGNTLHLAPGPTGDSWARAAHGLHRLVSRYMYREPGRLISVYVKDLAAGHEISYNPRVKIFGCSMLKMYVMAAIFARFEENDRRIATNEALLATGVPGGDTLRAEIAALQAERRLYEAFMYPMVVTSDNPQYGHFRTVFGDDHFARYVSRIGFVDTTMCAEDRTTTARDLARLFELFHTGELFHDPYLKRRPHALLSQAGRYGVAFHLPAYVPFMQKRGLRWHFDYQARHISGILYFRDHPVVVSVTSANPFFDYDACESVTDLSSRVARLLYHEVYQQAFYRGEPGFPSREGPES